MRAAGPSVVVVLHRSAPELGRLLASLERHLPERQLVVVDTAPGADDGARVAAEHGAEVVELGENPGFGPANNAALARCRRPVTLLLNPDTVLLDGSVARLLEAAGSSTALHVPALRDPDGTPQRSAHPVLGHFWELLPGLVPPSLLPGRLRRAAEPWRPDGRGPRRVGWAVAAALAASTALLRDLGPFDPGAFLHYEDLDLCLRAAARGVPTVLHPDVTLEHAGGHSTGRDPRPAPRRGGPAACGRRGAPRPAGAAPRRRRPSAHLRHARRTARRPRTPRPRPSCRPCAPPAEA